MTPPAKHDNWDDSDEDSTPPSSPPPAATSRHKRFDDEEDDSDVLESWDAEEDSDVEREKAKKAAEAKAKAEAEAKANKKTKSQRIEEHRMEKMRRRQEEEEEEEEESSSEDEAERRERMKRMEKESDMAHAAEMFGGMGVSDAAAKSKNAESKLTTIQLDPKNPASAVDLSTLKLFNPQTRDQFVDMRDTIAPLISANSKKAQYASFTIEFSKLIAKDLPSDQIKKIASGLTTLSNEKMKEEKASEKSGKKSKAAKSKATLNASRDTMAKADTRSYEDDGLGDDDFM